MSLDDNGLLIQWELNTAAPASSVQAYPAAGRGLGVSPDGKRLATSSQNGSAKLWDAKTRKFRWPMTSEAWQ